MRSLIRFYLERARKGACAANGLREVSAEQARRHLRTIRSQNRYGPVEKATKPRGTPEPPPPPTAPHPLPLATCAGFPSPQSAMWAVPHPRPRPRPSTPPHTELYKLTLLTTLSVALTLHLISSHLLLWKHQFFVDRLHNGSCAASHGGFPCNGGLLGGLWRWVDQRACHILWWKWRFWHNG